MFFLTSCYPYWYVFFVNFTTCIFSMFDEKKDTYITYLKFNFCQREGTTWENFNRSFCPTSCHRAFCFPRLPMLERFRSPDSTSRMIMKEDYSSARAKQYADVYCQARHVSAWRAITVSDFVPCGVLILNSKQIFAVIHNWCACARVRVCVCVCAHERARDELGTMVGVRNYGETLAHPTQHRNFIFLRREKRT